MNADATDTIGTKATEAKAKPIAIRLVPANNSDQPVLANYTTVHPTPGMVMLDFGFLEPAVLAGPPSVAKRGGKLPESLNGRLAARVAMGYDGLADAATAAHAAADGDREGGGGAGTMERAARHRSPMQCEQQRRVYRGGVPEARDRSV